MKKKKLLTFFTILFAGQLLGQELVDYSFRHYDQTNGFPAENIRSVEFDATGQLWCLTELGLMRYNGHSGKFYTYKSDGTGLLASQAFQLYIDKSQIIWITYFDNAISSFNPTSEIFTHYKFDSTKTKGFPNAMASRFFEDSQNNFWIGTWGGGLLKMDKNNGTFKQWMPDAKNPESLQSTQVTHINELKPGELIISTWEGDGYDNFLTVFNVENDIFRKYSLSRYSFENDVEKIRIPEALKIVHFVEIDEYKNWWVGTYSGLFYIDHQAKTILRKTGLNKDILSSKGHITSDNVTNMLQQNEDVIWFSTEVEGIMIYDKEKDAIKYIKKNVESQSSISSNIVRDIEKDRFGNIWVATKSGGLNLFCPNEGQAKVLSNEKLQATKMNVAQGMYAINHLIVSQANQNICVSHGSGITIYNPDREIVERIEIREPFLKALKSNPGLEKFNHNNPNFVGYTFEITDGFGICTYCGFVTYNYKTKKLDFSHMDIFDKIYPEAYQGSDTRLVLVGHYVTDENNVSTMNSSIAKLNTKTLVEENLLYLPTQISTREKEDYTVFEALDSNYYFISYTSNSFLIYDKSTNTYDTYSYLEPYKNFPDTSLKLLHVDHYGIAWFKTANGLYAFDKESNQITDIKPFLNIKPDENIRCLTRDKKGILWIALDYDLLRYNHNTKDLFRFNKKFGFDAGGFTDRFIRKHERSEVIMPANNGLLIFNPDRIVYHSSPPNIYISEIAIDKDTLSEDKKNQFVATHQDLKYNQNFINIEFASDLMYSTGGKTYLYRLVGLDSNWISTTQNSVNYTNLQNGEYAFQVKCVDGYGNTSDIVTVAFFIDKPFWLKWWFILIEIGLLILGVFVYIKWRERNHKYKQQQLQKAINERTQEVVEKVHEIEAQQEVILLKNKELTDSINYAKSIQNSILANQNLLEDNLPEHGIFFKPKDIVSGDFYWAAEVDDSFYLAICDSTGHGVPGAFMSLLNIRYLSEAVVEKNISSPNLALDYVRMKLIENLMVDGTKDGMDGTLIKFEKDTRRITYASAQNHPLLIRDGAEVFLPADKMPIGGGFLDDPFQPRVIEAQKGDVIYFYTDGYPDQFGGPKGRKLKIPNLVAFFKSIHHLPIENQITLMERHLENWRGDLEQLDDILVFVVRVN